MTGCSKRSRATPKMRTKIENKITGKRDRKYIDRERVERNRHQASRSGKDAVADETQRPQTDERDAGGLVVGVVIASGSSSQDGSLFLLHAIIASALTIRLTLRLEVPG